MTGPLDPPYYASGSLPRRPSSINSNSLTRTNSMRNSWAVNKRLVNGEAYVTRTASVLHKPRPRPLLVTNLDDYGLRPNQASTLDSFHTNTNSTSPNRRTPTSKGSTNDSDSNLSYRSSLDIVDTATSKVFQNQLLNLKKLFRYLPSRRSFGFNSDQKSSNSYWGKTKPQVLLSSASSKDHAVDGGRTLGESISQICLNRSQSPPVCPPPPRELKSMAYIENSVNYSNYDEFTRARNKQTASILNAQRNDTDDIGPRSIERDDVDSWQLTSLPLSYERNLNTVFEERPLNDHAKHLIEPPEQFADNVYENLASQSLTSITTTDSVFDYRHTSSSFKYTNAAQPNEQGPPRNANLPPRIPVCSNGDSSFNAMGRTNQQVLPADQSPAYDLDNDTDADTTILSDTSTIQGDSNGVNYENKCAELECTVESLKNKLIAKEKELTDLQLKQWSSDYLISQLKSTNSRLEREITQLKSVIVTNNRVNM